MLQKYAIIMQHKNQRYYTSAIIGGQSALLTASQKFHAAVDVQQEKYYTAYLLMFQPQSLTWMPSPEQFLIMGFSEKLML